MSLLSNLRYRTAAWALRAANNDQIEVEAFVRGKSTKDEPLSDKLTTAATALAKQDLKKWKTAVTAATDPEAPDYSLLIELYQNLMLDSHLMSVLESRILKVQQSNFKLADKSGKENEELTMLFEGDWFFDWIRFALMVQYDGPALVEMWETTEEGFLKKVSKIPTQNVSFIKKLILKEPGASTGENYAEGVYEPYYMQIGDHKNIGILADMAPVILAKKLAIGSWLDFIEKFGVPPRWVTTDRQDTTRRNELFNMMLAMISNQVAVLTGNEKIEIANTPNTDAYQVFDSMIERMNSEISKRIMGATGTTDEKAYVGSAKVHQEVANDRHESDKVFIKNLINDELIPRLIKISSAYAPLANYTFMWDYTEEMSAADIIESVAKLSSDFEFDIEELKKLTGLPITGVKRAAEPQQPGGAGEKK